MIKPHYYLAVLLFVVTAFLLCMVPIKAKSALGVPDFTNASVLGKADSNALTLLEKSLSCRLAVLGNSNVPEGNVVRVNTTNSTTKGTPDYDALNNSTPNTRYELDNGTTFNTNSGGRVEEVTFTPVDTKIPRDSRQTQVGKEGLPSDVGGHIQACSMGGTCDRFNLFPQDKNFNSSGYKKFENEIRNSLKNGDDVGAVTVKFKRSDPNAARPDALRVEYTINGKQFRKEFKNQHGG